VRICANFGAQISRGIPRDLTRQCANRPPVAASSWAFRRSIGIERVRDELISPELVLVCPDLRAKALAALPAQPPCGPVIEEPFGRSHATIVYEAATERRAGAIPRAIGAYVLVRIADLVAITAAIVLFVLLLATVAAAMRS
jgi:hypothetical protein